MPELGPPIRDLGGRRCRLWIVQQTIYAGVHVHAARRRTCTCEVAIEVGAPMCLNITKFFLLRVNSRVSAKIILVLGPNFGNPQSHGSKTPNRLRKFRNGTCNSNNLDEKCGNTGLSTLHFRTLQIFTITQTQKID